MAADNGEERAQKQRREEKERITRCITPLHIALWNGNALQVESGLKAQADALETRDPRGHRALHLALKFAHRDAKSIVTRLLNAGARVRSRDLSGWKTVHHAIASENEDILRLLIQKEKEQTPVLLGKKIHDVTTQLKQVPDFYYTIKIWKRGNDLRLDMTLVGFEKTGWLRGDVSFLLLGQQCQFLCLDNQAKTCTNLLATGTALTKRDLDDMVHFLMTTSMSNTFMDASALEFSRRRSLVLKSDVFESIGQWKRCAVFDMTGVEVVMRRRAPQTPTRGDPHGNISSTRTAFEAFTTATTKSVDVTIAAGAEHVVSVEMAANETLHWSFQVLANDVEFSIRFLHDDDDQATANRRGVVPVQRYDVDTGPHSGSFTAQVGGTAVLKWDNSYSRFRSKDICFMLSVNTDNSETRAWDAHRATEKLMTFEEWFGVSIAALPDALRDLHPRASIMVHDPPPHSSIKKTFSATVYSSDDFPLTVEQFMPIVEVLSSTSSAFENTRDFFSTELGSGFPVQFCFPLVPSFSATLRFDRMDLETPHASLFAVPQDFNHCEEDVLSPRTHHEMLQNLTAM